MSPTEAFPPEVIRAVCAHMNDDHVEDSLLIVRSLGGCPDAVAASMSGLDTVAAHFTAVVDGADREVRVPWSAPITERAQIRVEVVRLYHDACAMLGVDPRPPVDH